MYVIPVKGRSVPDPFRGDLLPERGRNVERSSYWLRRIESGDVREQIPVEKTNTGDELLVTDENTSEADK